MKKKVAIIGGGTAALFLAAFLDQTKFEVCIYEKKATVGRKFLVAGDGGFNLTHSEDLQDFIKKYTPSDFTKDILSDFSAVELRDWLKAIGIDTFVGSSGRVFPVKGIKPAQVLKAIMEHLASVGVKIITQHSFTNWNEQGEIIFNNELVIQADHIVFALGGASWKKTGSDGSWLNIFKEKGIETTSFVAQNCAFQVSWEEEFIDEFAGKPLKNISISFAEQSQKGEVVITKFGLEGNAIYALSPMIQDALSLENRAEIYVDFKPMLDTKSIVRKLKESTNNTTATLRKALKLSPSAIALLKQNLSKPEFLDHDYLAKSIKRFPIVLASAAPIDEAISTSGGVALSAITSDFELKKFKGHYCIGEMLDWTAPTGGYLIQGCASMGVALARALNRG